MPELRRLNFPTIEVQGEVLRRKQDTVWVMLPQVG